MQINASICSHWKDVNECPICSKTLKSTPDRAPQTVTQGDITLDQLPNTLYIDDDSNRTKVPPDKKTPPVKAITKKPAPPKPAVTSTQTHKKPDEALLPGQIPEPTEFWTDEEKKIISNALTGIGIVTGAGLGLYAALYGLGLVGGKATASGAAVAKAAAELAKTGQTSVLPGSNGSSEAISGGDSPLPTPGDTRSYVDEHGKRWIEVFNGQNWIDSDSHSAIQEAQAQNQAWQETQFQRQSSGDTAFDDRLRETAERAEADRREIQIKNRAEIKSINQFLQEMAEGDRTRMQSDLARAEKNLKTLELSKTLLDCVSMPTLGAGTGVAGFAVSTTYSLASEAVGGLTEGIVNASSTLEAVNNGVKGAAQGLVSGAVGIVVGEGLNSLAAVGSTAFRKFCSTIPLRNPGQVVPKVMHNESGASETINYLWNNFSKGRPPAEGILKQFPRIHKPAGRRFTSLNISDTARYQKEISAFSKSTTVWGLASGVKSYAIDQPLAGTVNERLFGK